MTKKAEQIRTKLIYKVRDSAKAKGISQEKIAEKSGRTQPTISGILKGNKAITLDTFIDVCNASDIEIVLISKNKKQEAAIDFGDWLLGHDIVYIDNTSDGNIYDYNGLRLTMKELYSNYLKS